MKRYDHTKPLVSVLVYNYNYGQYLEQCLNSIFNQTYSNIEVNFSDNASTDDSWQVALKFVEKYPDRITVTRNRNNYGTDANFNNCYVNCRGKYFINMCSDDILAPSYVERCVSVLEANSALAFVMVHRSICDANGNISEEAPFYNKSCIIDGPEQASVYMMASVNPSVSQIMYCADKVDWHTVEGVFIARWYAMRILDFNLCMHHPIAFLSDPLLIHRLHGNNDSLAAADNLMEVIGPYVLQHQFADIASTFKHHNVVNRLPESIEKLAQQCLRYCTRALLTGDEVTAKKYFHLTYVMSPEIEGNETIVLLNDYWKENDEQAKQKILTLLTQQEQLISRTVSYEPPTNSQPL